MYTAKPLGVALIASADSNIEIRRGHTTHVSGQPYRSAHATPVTSLTLNYACNFALEQEPPGCTRRPRSTHAQGSPFTPRPI